MHEQFYGEIWNCATYRASERHSRVPNDIHGYQIQLRVPRTIARHVAHSAKSIRENDVSEVVHVQERNVAKDKTASSNQDVLGENDVSEVEKSPARTVTLAVGENSVLVNQSHSRSTNVGTVQCTESSCIPPNAETSLPESNEPPPPASSHRNNDVLQPSNTHPLNKVPPAPHNVCRVEVRPVRKFRWLPYGNYNVRHPYWEAICWEKYQRQNRSNHWTNHPTDYRYRRKPWEYVPQRFYGRNQYF